MPAESVTRLDFKGPNGEQIFLIVDFSTKMASVAIVDVRNGNIRVTDVQSIATRGV